MVQRRAFLGWAAALAATWPSASLAWGDDAELVRPPIIDGLGEIRVGYDARVLQDIAASGLGCCVVTVGNPAAPERQALSDLVEEVKAFNAFVTRHRGEFTTARSSADIARAQKQGRIALVFYAQNTTALGENLARLDELHRLGVVALQLTYNDRNAVGDGYLEPTNGGLSRFGLDVVARMNELKMLIDVSHCGDATADGAIHFSSAPVAITHAGCRAVFDHPRNKNDETLRAMARKGGVIGIFQVNPYLGPNERNSLDDYLRHIDHAIDVAGIDHVGIGSDREYRMVPDTADERRKLADDLSRLRSANTLHWPYFVEALNHPRRMETLGEALTRRGRTASEVDKILGGNFYRLFKETIG